MNRNNIYTVNPLYNGSTTQTTEDGSVQSGGTTIIYQQGGGTGLTDAQKQKLDGIQEGAEVNQNAYSKVRLNGSDALIIEAKNKTDILNMSGVYPIAIAINGNGGLDFTVSSDQSNTNSVVTQSQLKAAIDQLEKDKYWKVDADGKLYTELDVYSHKEISAYGAGDGGGSTGGAGALYECADVLRDGDKVKGAEVGSVLSYNGTHWYAIPQSAIVPDLSGYATKSYVSQEINDLIGGAPGTLDTLKEIAEALGNDPNFATTITNMINNIGLRVDDIESRVVSLEDMFEWDKSASASDPSLWRIKAKKDLYGVGEISAYGYSSGTVPTGAQYMYELKDVLFTELTSGQLLQWNGTKWINIDKNAVGLNETELGRYLTNNNYAKKTDITWANLLNKPTTWAWADITGKPTTLAGYGITDAVISSRQVLAGNGLTGGGALTSDVTLSLNTIGTAGTYTKITTDQYGRVVSGTILSEGDIPTLQISKISGLQSALDSKLNISDFNTWFTINRDTSGNIVSIQANYNLFSVGEVSAYGLGGTQPSITMLAELDDVNISNPQNKQALIYDSASGKWINGASVAGGNISLNGTVYEAVDGLITLPNLYKKVAGGTSSQFLKADGSVDSNVYLTQASTDSRYVLKTGDTMTGNLYVPFISTAVNPEDQGNYFYSSDDNFIRRSTWHAALSHLSQKQLALDLTSLDQNKWYPCIIGAPAYSGTPLRITIFNGLTGNKPSWALNASGFSLLLDYYVTGSGWGTLSAVSKLDWYHGSYGGETAFGGRQQNIMASTEIIYLRGGGMYYYRTTNGDALTVQPNGYTWSSGSYNYSAPVKTSQDNSPMEKTFDQVYWAPNNLRNTRTIWGQPFNGSQNVSGALSGATTITATGDITTSANIGGRSIYASADLTAAGYIYCNGRLYVDRDRHPTVTPLISLAIGDNDTGFNWDHDGYINFVANEVNAGYWGSTEARFHNAYFRIPSGNDYHTLGIMVNGNGTANTIKPGIGFHQPGVYANSLRSDGPGDFRFCVQGGTVGCQVQAGSFYANGGLIYSNANGCQAAFGSQNTGYVHITNNANRAYYMDHTLHISGDVAPYTNEANTLGNSSKWWGGIYGKEVYVSSWVRFTGASGVCWTAYDGGWHMTDSTWIRAYNNKQIYTGSTSADAIHTAGGINASGRIYAGGHLSTNGGLAVSGIYGGSGASGFNVYAVFQGRSDHGGIEVRASDNTFGIGVHSNDHMYWWWGAATSTNSSSGKFYIMDYGGGSWSFTGSIVASGEVTAYSDARLKSNIHTLDYRGRLIPRHYVKDGKQSIGFIAQEVQTLYPELVLGYDKSRPYLSLNYNGCTAVLSAQLNHVEDEVTMLKNKVRELEIKVSVLTEQLHSQAI